MQSISTESCCPHGSLPSLTPAESYVEKGKEIMLGDLPVYLTSSDANANSAIIVGYDIYGFHGGRIRNICDEIAEAGHMVLLVDFFRGDCWTANREATESGSKMEWIRRVSDPNRITDDIDNKIIPFCKETYNIHKFACVGFCFGGFVSFLASQSNAFSCAAGIHSSIKIFNFHNSNELDAVSKLQCPQLIIQGHNDPPNTKPNAEVHQALLQQPFGNECEVIELVDVAHGWVPRGNLEDPIVAENIQNTMKLVKTFLKKHL